MKRVLLLLVMSLFFMAAAAENAGSYRVLLLGDVHYDRSELHSDPDIAKNKSHIRNIGMWKRKTPELLTLAAKCAEAESPAFVVQLGDLTQGYAGTEELQQRMLTEGVAAVKAYFPKTPLLVVRGNHDASVRSGAYDSAPANAVLLPHTAAEFALKEPGKNGNYAFRQGKDLFIAVDDFLPAKEIVAFVKRTLNAHPDARYVFFMTHLPVLPASAGAPFWLLPGHYQVAALLETRQALILAGHTHIPSLECRVTKRGTLRQLIISSMGNKWNPVRIVPPRITSWEDFVKIGKSRPLHGINRNNPKHWPVLEKKGKYSFTQLFNNSGFALLRVDDGGYTVEYFTGGEKPAYTFKSSQPLCP